MTETQEQFVIEQQRQTIERQRAYIEILEETIEGESSNGLHYITQRRLENGLMIGMCLSAAICLVCLWLFW